MDDFNYFDFIGCDESILFPIIGIIFSPVLFPLYLVLKAITMLLELLMDALDTLFTKEEKPVIKNEKNDEEERQRKIEQLENKIEDLKKQKRIIESQMKENNQEEFYQEEKPISLTRKSKKL